MTCIGPNGQKGQTPNHRKARKYHFKKWQRGSDFNLFILNVFTTLLIITDIGVSCHIQQTLTHYSQQTET